MAEKRGEWWSSFLILIKTGRRFISDVTGDAARRTGENIIGIFKFERAD
jgi:hypothetical protein